MSSDFTLKFSSHLHSSIRHDVLRKWNSVSPINSNSLMYPIFIIEDDNKTEEISSMPGISRYGIEALVAHLKPLVKKGLKSVLLFGVISKLPKDEFGSNADSRKNPVIRAIPVLKKHFPHLLIVCDVCLCPYTSHGHCGLLNEDGTIDNKSSIKRIQEIAVAYASSGCDVVAPSDMMDGRVGAIRSGLLAQGLQAAILAYSAKFASSFYGPFRGACDSAPSSGDRRGYQLPPASAGLALRAVKRDADEGADFLMVKPGLPYLDIIKQTKDALPQYPLLVYQVSGEYAMIYYASQAGVVSLKSAVWESITSFVRAGADCVITYFTPHILDWLSEGSFVQ